MSFYIESYNFSKPVRNANGKLLADDVMGTNWPVVYLIHGNKELYIGETSDADGRMNQHLDPCGTYYQKRKKLEKVEIVFDTTFNKSAILDIEQSLIRLFKFEVNSKDPNKRSLYFKTLQNGNSGQSRQHNYYQRSHYQQEVETIWNELVKKNIATHNYQDIINDSIFKFSPYNTLTTEQSETCLDILEEAIEALFADKEGRAGNNKFTAVVKGSAGTGKTIVLLHMMSRIVEAMNLNQASINNDSDIDIDDEDDGATLAVLKRTSKLALRIREYTMKYGKLKIAYVAQMTSLRSTIASALKAIPHLKKNDAIGPNDVVNKSGAGTDHFEKYDILFIDEAHRLWQRKKISSMGAFDVASRKVFGPDVDLQNTTTLDWLMACSKTRVMVYDALQTVKESDITPEQYRKAIQSEDVGKFKEYTLKQQMRCLGGMDYIRYLNDILDCSANLVKRDIEDYSLVLMNDPNELIERIVMHNGQVGLSRVAAGYGWQWNSKAYDKCHTKFKKAVANGEVSDTRKSQVEFYLNHMSLDDGLIQFGDKRYVRNLDYNWIIDGNPREIGCIHTSQGYDLNYVGVLFGPEIDYKEGEGIVIYPDKIKDSSVGHSLRGLSETDAILKKQIIKDYILNAYKVMMERGIKGCYVWAYNSGLQNYLSKYI